MPKRHVNPHPPQLKLLESDTTFELFARIPGEAPEAVDVEYADGVLHLRLLGDTSKARWSPGERRLWSARLEFGEQVAQGADLRAVHEGGWLHVSLPKAHPGPARLQAALEPDRDAVGLDDELSDPADDLLDDLFDGRG